MTAAAHHVPATLQWRDDELHLLDQTRLPLQIHIERQDDAQQVWQSIRQLKVRGAPAIGVAAAYGLCVAMRPHQALGLQEFRETLRQNAQYLTTARPTAVNLAWALQRMCNTSHACRWRNFARCCRRCPCSSSRPIRKGCAFLHWRRWPAERLSSRPAVAGPNSS